jgi:transposase
VIPTGGRIEVFVHREPVDMRKHYDGLWGLVVALGRSPFDGALYAFVGKTRKRAKLLWWDGTGVLVLCNQPSSYYTSFGSKGGSCSYAWGARMAAARSASRSQRLLCFAGRFGSSS